MASTMLTYDGPPALIVEIEREINQGDVFTVDEALAPKLLQVIGVREAKPSETKKAKEED